MYVVYIYPELILKTYDIYYACEDALLPCEDPL